MIEGVISDEFEPVIELQLLTPQGGLIPLRAVVDPGFNGCLTLPSDRIRRLGLIQIGHSRVELADGSFIISGVYDAVVMWGAFERLIPVEVADGDPLVGMKLLDGSDLHRSVQRGGRIRISPRLT